MTASAPIGSAQPAASRWRPLLRTAGVGFVGGVLIWGMGDVLGEFTTFIKLREKGVALANNSQELRGQIGHPFSVGPWYNSSIGFSAGGNVAQCTFQLQGTKQITDVTVRCMRGDGTSINRALYNLVGSGAWKVIDCTAMFPSGGGLVQPRSLLPKTASDRPSQRDRPSLHHTLPDEPVASSDEGTAHSVAPEQGRDTSVVPAGAGVTITHELANGGGGGQGSLAAGRTWWGWIRGRPKTTSPDP